MLTTRIFNPTMLVGTVYARPYGEALPLQSIGGVESLEINIEEDKLRQRDYEHRGGGNRTGINLVKSIGLKAKLQDINYINLARAVFGLSTAVIAGTVVDEPHKAYQGGLIRLLHLKPTTVVVKKASTTIAAAGNYEVRPEGIFILDDAADITDGDDITVGYAHSGYDVIQAITAAAPVLEMSFAGLNEGMDGAPCVVDIFRVQLSPAKTLNLINKDLSTLDIDSEVLSDPTKTGAGISRFFRVSMV